MLTSNAASDMIDWPPRLCPTAVVNFALWRYGSQAALLQGQTKLLMLACPCAASSATIIDLAPTELAPPDVGGKKDLCAFFKMAFRSQLRDVWYSLNAGSRHAAGVEQWKRADRR